METCRGVVRILAGVGCRKGLQHCGIVLSDWVYIPSRVRGSVTIITGSGLDLLALLLQLQAIITAHNQWLPKTRAIPY
jgi:hypothetical protein